MFYLRNCFELYVETLYNTLFSFCEHVYMWFYIPKLPNNYKIVNTKQIVTTRKQKMYLNETGENVEDISYLVNLYSGKSIPLSILEICINKKISKLIEIDGSNTFEYTKPEETINI